MFDQRCAAPCGAPKSITFGSMCPATARARVADKIGGNNVLPLKHLAARFVLPWHVAAVLWLDRSAGPRVVWRKFAAAIEIMAMTEVIARATFLALSKVG
jgi:hypothetical protein